MKCDKSLFYCEFGPIGKYIELTAIGMSGNARCHSYVGEDFISLGRRHLHAQD